MASKATTTKHHYNMYYLHCIVQRSLCKHSLMQCKN